MARQTRLDIPLVSDDPQVPKPRLTKLIVRNFRCIGTNPVEIDLDEIVILVGPNNVGKSSILKAYELAMSQGSKEGQLTIEDFPSNKIDPENLPEIEVHTIVFVNSPGAEWITTLENGEQLVKERWVWHGPGGAKREGWNVTEQTWSDKVPWGAPNVANTRRPEPHRVNAFDPPDAQAKAITDLLLGALNDRVKNLQSEKQGDGEQNEYHEVLDKIKELQTKIVGEVQQQIDAVNTELTGLIERVFPTYRIDFDAKPEDNLDKAINLFKTGPQLLMGPKDGYLSTIDRQGSGARRTLLWVALKFISETNQKLSEEGTPIRPHLLLIDEPEICLHPNAIREACKVLYDLPNSGQWQVMVTTHCPIFLDFSRDNTTIVKVGITGDGVVRGTTVFRPSQISLGEDDKTNLKFLNLCDPYVSEFFFGGKTIIVEGDTEYTAFKHVIGKNPDEYKDVHIVRARGKATIVSLVKILNHFGSSYSVLHDSDVPTILTKDGKTMKNSAWTMNQHILDAMNSRPEEVRVRLLASVPNFEEAYFGQATNTEKPYNAMVQISSNAELFANVEQLLMALINLDADAPGNCSEWKSLDELEEVATA